MSPLECFTFGFEIRNSEFVYSMCGELLLSTHISLFWYANIKEIIIMTLFIFNYFLGDLCDHKGSDD